MKRSVILMRAYDAKRAQEARECELVRFSDREYREGVRNFDRRMPAIREDD